MLSNYPVNVAEIIILKGNVLNSHSRCELQNEDRWTESMNTVLW